MSRPKPQVLIEHINKQTYKTEQVLASAGVWAVFYDAKPINLKTANMLTQYLEKLFGTLCRPFQSIIVTNSTHFHF